MRVGGGRGCASGDGRQIGPRLFRSLQQHDSLNLRSPTIVPLWVPLAKGVLRDPGGQRRVNRRLQFPAWELGGRGQVLAETHRETRDTSRLGR